jgi:mono/diheme cytochrome c family protein
VKGIVQALLITLFLGVGGVALTFAFGTADASPKAFTSTELDQVQLDHVEQGRFIYTIRCMTCHGMNGDGNPVTPEGLPIKPRDFTGKSHVREQVMFKFKSLNKNDPLALDEDLIKTIREGLPGTPMPGFSNLSDEDIYAVVRYIKTFAYDQWRLNQPISPAIQVPSIPQDIASPQRVDQGRALFTSRGCIACHGDIEQGSEPPVPLPTEWRDEEGSVVLVWPLNFVTSPMRRPATQDIFKTIRLGIGGTAMPPHSLSDEETWDLIVYVSHLRQQSR